VLRRIDMAHNTIEGRNLYLRVTEPLHFVNTLAKNASLSMEKGYLITIMLGGPEAFPSHTFTGKDILSKKLLLFIDSMAYWTRMMIDVKGRSDAENEKAIDNLLAGIEGEVEAH
jgi:hypothetical protein